MRFSLRRPATQPGQASFVSPDEVAVQGGGAPRAGVLPAARFEFLRPRLTPRQAYQDARGAGYQPAMGSGEGSRVRMAPGQGLGIAVLDLPVPPTKMPRHPKRSRTTGSPLDYGNANNPQMVPPAVPWDARANAWFAPVAAMTFANWTLSGGMVDDHGAIAEWTRGGVS